MNNRPLLFDELNRTTLGQLAPTSLAVLPVGATEQHGPHLATGTDRFAVEHIARSAAARASDAGSIIVTPTLPFGSSDHHFAFGATLSIGTQTYYMVLKDLVASLVRDGFRKVLIVNGHGGNHELIQLAARDVSLVQTVQVGAVTYWDPARAQLDELWVGKPGHRPPGHAGEFETSVVMHLRPDIPVDAPSRADDVVAALTPSTPGWRLEETGWWTTIDGFTDNPSLATPEKGARFLEIVIDGLAMVMRDFLIRS